MTYIDEKAANRGLTDIDRTILSKLELDGRMSITKLANSLNISRAYVRDRIALMQERGVIRRFTVEIRSNAQEEMRCGGAFFQLKLRRPTCRLVYASIRGWPELMGCWSISGEIDMIVLIAALSNLEVETLRDRLSRHPEVKSLVTISILREWTHDLDMRNAHIVGDRLPEPQEEWKPLGERATSSV